MKFDTAQEAWLYCNKEFHTSFERPLNQRNHKYK